MNTVPRWTLVAMLVLTLGVDLVIGAWEEQNLRHEIHQLEAECRENQARRDEARVEFQRWVVKARAFTRPAQDVVAVPETELAAAPRALPSEAEYAQSRADR